MKSFACGDVIPGCEGRVTADDEEGILAWAGEHAPAVHGIEVSRELVETVRGHVVPVCLGQNGHFGPRVFRRIRR